MHANGILASPRCTITDLGYNLLLRTVALVFRALFKNTAWHSADRLHALVTFYRGSVGYNLLLLTVAKILLEEMSPINN